MGVLAVGQRSKASLPTRQPRLFMTALCRQRPGGHGPRLPGLHTHDRRRRQRGLGKLTRSSSSSHWPLASTKLHDQ